MDWLIQVFHQAGLNLVQSIHFAYDSRDWSFMEYVVIMFGGGDERESFKQARKLERCFLNAGASRDSFYFNPNHKKPCLWVAKQYAYG